MAYGSSDHLKLLFSQSSDTDSSLSGNFNYGTEFHRVHGSPQFRAAAEWLLRDQAFNRVELFAATGNTASQRVAEKSGFVREGVARNSGFTHSGQQDMVMFSLVPADLAP